jgi:RNA polymerase sigma factor (sigma-70 family)
VAETAAPQRADSDARLATVYELYAASLRKRCLRLTGDPVAADDLTQEVFTRFLAKVSRPPAGMNVHGYLLAMAHNVWVNQIRAESAFSVQEIDDARTADDRIENDPVRSLLLGEQQGLVRRGAAGLPERQRRALALRELDGRSYAEIGVELGIGTNAVAQVVWRARGQLRRALRRFQVDPERLPETCRAMLDDMSDLLDSSEGRGTQELETHLAGCRSCRGALASYRDAGSRLRGAFPLLPLAAMLARAAGTLRACVEAPAAIGTAATVTVAVVAVGGGGGAILATHAVNSSAAARAAAPSALRSNPSRLARTPLPAPQLRSLVVVVLPAHARRTASAHGPRIVTPDPRATLPAGPTSGSVVARAPVTPAPPAPPAPAPEVVPAQDPSAVPAGDPAVVPAYEPAVVAAPPENGKTHPDVVNASVGSMGDATAETAWRAQREKVASTSSDPSPAPSDKHSEKAATMPRGSTEEAPASPAVTADAAPAPPEQASPGKAAAKAGKIGKDAGGAPQAPQASPGVASPAAPAAAPPPAAAAAQAPAAAAPSQSPAPSVEQPVEPTPAEASSPVTPDADEGQYGGAGGQPPTHA